MYCIQNDLVHFEQFVNDRRRSSPPPTISQDLLPESSTFHPMPWVVLPASEVRILSDCNNGDIPKYARDLLGNDGSVAFFPIHPLQREYYNSRSIIESGKFRVSASYRTVFYEPEENGVVRLTPPPGHILMIKLHLDEPLPGIDGDRRLTPNIIDKCISASRELTTLQSNGYLNPILSIIREEIGIIHGNRGALIRKIPNKLLVPGFALSSPDQTDTNKDILASSILKMRSQITGKSGPDLFGEVFAEPLINSLFSAFNQGFSLEMHMQNFLLLFGVSGLIEQVLYRDLEGIVFSNSIRHARNLPEIFVGNYNPELHKYSSHISRYFNRNLDHDLGRFFDNVLLALEKCNFFKPWDRARAVFSVRKAVRNAVKMYDLQKWAFWPRLLRFARSPYGNGRRPIHYYRCRYR